MKDEKIYSLMDIEDEEVKSSSDKKEDSKKEDSKKEEIKSNLSDIKNKLNKGYYKPIDIEEKGNEDVYDRSEDGKKEDEKEKEITEEDKFDTEDDKKTDESIDKEDQGDTDDKLDDDSKNENVDEASMVKAEEKKEEEKTIKDILRETIDRNINVTKGRIENIKVSILEKKSIGNDFVEDLKGIIKNDPNIQLTVLLGALISPELFKNVNPNEIFNNLINLKETDLNKDLKTNLSELFSKTQNNISGALSSIMDLFKLEVKRKEEELNNIKNTINIIGKIMEGIKLQFNSLIAF